MLPALQAIADRAFLALTIWREARGEDHATKTGVAFSVLNRVARPSWWGADVESVVFKKWQYSSLTDPHDPQLTTWPLSSDSRWEECLQIACDALDGKLTNPVGGADSYFDISISPPAWATPDKFVTQLGRIRFFDVDKDHEAQAGWTDSGASLPGSN